MSAVSGADTPDVLERFHAELPLVEIIAAQVRREIGHPSEIDDLVAAGREGLLGAARRFDPSRGVPFRAYANNRIRWAILDSVRQLSFLPRRAHERIVALQATTLTNEGAAEHAFAGGSTRKASAADLALEKHLASLATAATVGLATDTPDEISNELSPEEALAHAELAHLVLAAVDKLSKDEGLLIRRHYLEGERIEDVARELNISDSWASRLHTRAIARLNKRLHHLA